MTDFKPMLTVPEQIARMKEKGITFKLFSEEDAAEYLEGNNNYFKIAAYRHNYDKRADGTYIHLDFAYLRDLAIIDMKLRYVCIQLALDIEHYAKMDILRSCVDHKEDGYQIFLDYIMHLSPDQQNRVFGELKRSSRSIYYHDLFEKYDPAYFPIWAFLEVASFGQLISFYKFCGDVRYKDSRILDMSYLLKTCKDIRNASAHNTCILNDLHPHTAKYRANYFVMQKLSRSAVLKSGVREKRMSSIRVQQIVTLLYTHLALVTGVGIHSKTCQLLQDLSIRISKNISFYETNEMVLSNLRFVQQIISEWFAE